MTSGSDSRPSPADYAAWGPEARGVKLFVDSHYPVPDIGLYSLDVETDEADNFVGMALCDGYEVYYYTSLEEADYRLPQLKLVGHSIKDDLHFLRKNGVALDPANVVWDTLLASYIANPTKDSHALKTLAKEMLGWEYPTYKEMTGKGRTKLTLDKQPLEQVAAYCAMDALSTWRIYQKQQASLTANQRRLLLSMELPINRLLYRMEEKGVTLDVSYLKELEARFAQEIQELESQIAQAVQPTLLANGEGRAA